MKVRPARSFERAVQHIIMSIGQEAAAKAVGRSTSLIRKWSDQDNLSLPSLRQAVALDEAFVRICQQPAPIKAVYNYRLEHIIDQTAPKIETLGMALFNIQLAVGTITRSIADLMNDEENVDNVKINPRLKAALLSDVEKLASEVVDLETAIKKQ